MKEQFAILPELPIVGTLKLSSRDGKSLCHIDVVRKQKPTELNEFFQHCYEELYRFLSGQSRSIKIKLDFSGMSEFQKKVLLEMKKIPYGKVATYKDIANAMNSKGFQAIGAACGNNPFMLIYPCHRVLGTGNMGGFAHGLKMKQKLLNLEGFQ